MDMDESEGWYLSKEVASTMGEMWDHTVRLIAWS